MGKDIKLNSSEWCDTVFEGKNKTYGAYRLRQSSSKRHIAAFLVILLFAIFVSILPLLLDFVKSLRPEQVTQDQVYTQTAIPIEDQVKKEDIIKKENAPPPPPLKTTIKVVPPTISKDVDVKDEDEMKGQSDLNKGRIQMSVKDVKGTDDKKGADIGDLKEHKVIIAAAPEEDKPFVTAEQMPDYPGGIKEMYKFINANVVYPPAAQEAGIQGTVYLAFVVSKTGDITDVKVSRGIDSSCDKEALRVLKSMPRWIPGKQNGRNVAVYYSIKVQFKLQ